MKRQGASLLPLLEAFHAGTPLVASEFQELLDAGWISQRPRSFPAYVLTSKGAELLKGGHRV